MKTKKHLYLSMFLILLTVFTVTAQSKQDILSNESLTTLFNKGLGTGIQSCLFSGWFEIGIYVLK